MADNLAKQIENLRAETRKIKDRCFELEQQNIEIETDIAELKESGPTYHEDGTVEGGWDKSMKAQKSVLASEANLSGKAITLKK